jgi:hypothetical protein
MFRALTLALLTVLVVATLGCGAAREAEKAAANAPTADVNGTWSGSAGTGGQFVPITMNLTQSGTSVNGQISIGGRPDLSGAVKGTVQGELIKLSLERATLGEMRVKDNTMSGEVSGGLPATLRRSR